MVWFPLVIILMVLAFYFWMLNDMLHNPTLPPCYISFSGRRDYRTDWMMAFIILSLFTAGYYYLNVYRPGKS